MRRPSPTQASSSIAVARGAVCRRPATASAVSGPSASAANSRMSLAASRVAEAQYPVARSINADGSGGRSGMGVLLSERGQDLDDLRPCYAALLLGGLGAQRHHALRHLPVAE